MFTHFLAKLGGDAGAARLAGCLFLSAVNWRKGERRSGFQAFHLFPAGSTKETKEVGAGVVLRRPRERPQRRLRAAEPGGQRRHANAGGQEDGREDGDAAQRVGGHHHYRGVQRSGRSAHRTHTEEAPRSHRVWGGLLFQDHGITAVSEVSYSSRQTVSPVSTNRVATQTPPTPPSLNNKSFPVRFTSAV